MNEADLETSLKGKTLRVYIYLLKKSGSKVGVREVQRALKFSSPSLAAYHLDKLVSLGLADKTATGEYFLRQEVKIGILKLFVRVIKMKATSSPSDWDLKALRPNGEVYDTQVRVLRGVDDEYAHYVYSSIRAHMEHTQHRGANLRLISLNSLLDRNH